MSSANVTLSTSRAIFAATFIVLFCACSALTIVAWGDAESALVVNVFAFKNA
ncbi:MAG: hypothetical protein Q7U12_12925 [Undibacterium sp.]|nr:hypothetical protein [Undibacterium sp.]MDO8702064.1 hypothetical protein [Undibacterium sp.]MDO9193794.1 hypothetical protein [Undibacterium sp.]